MSAVVIQFMEQAQAAYQQHENPELAEKYATLLSLYKQKKWHQLTLKLEEFLLTPGLSEAELVQLYANFIRDFEVKLNQLKLVQMVIVISRHISDPLVSLNFLQEMSKKIDKEKNREASILLRAVIAGYYIRSDQIGECKKMIDECQADLDNATGLDPSVYACFYHVCCQYYNKQANLAEFHKAGFQYLAYQPLDRIPEIEKKQLAFHLGLATLVGENNYNFGELLLHPVAKSLEAEEPWMLHLLRAFNTGDINKFDELVHTYSKELQNQPLLVASSQLLREKISIMALIELIFNRPAGARSIPFTTIATATKLPLDEVELLLIKSLSLKLVKGIIDQIAQVVNITWVQPRVLDISQIAAMGQKLTAWSANVNKTLVWMEGETSDIVV